MQTYVDWGAGTWVLGSAAPEVGMAPGVGVDMPPGVGMVTGTAPEKQVVVQSRSAVAVLILVHGQPVQGLDRGVGRPAHRMGVVGKPGSSGNRNNTQDA